ncbi:MAG: hypothetical protein DGJ47_000446 [Rickettsiaceae bacterium]
MFDAHLRPTIDPPLNFIGKKLSRMQITANMVTLFGFAIGIISMFMIISHNFIWGFIFLLLNRLCDGLDGAVARNFPVNNFGGFLDITCDFIVFSGIVFAFGISDPEKALYSAFLIFSFIGPITSFLAYAIIAAKQNKICNKRGRKSFYYCGGICEGFETFLALSLLCLLPQHHNIICLIYGLLCWITAFGRCYCAWIDFGQEA